MKVFPNRTKSQQTKIITMSDLTRIKNTIIPPIKDEEERKKYDQHLKTLSNTRAQQWSDSLEQGKKEKLETRKKLFIEKEEEKRRIDEEERKFQEMEKKLIIEKANKFMFDNQDPVKAFHSKMLFCDVIKERDFQNEIKQRKKEMQEEDELRWLQLQHKQIIDYDIKEQFRIESDHFKKQDQMNMINDQFNDFKVKKVKEYQDRVIEGEIIKAKARAAIEEEKHKDNERRNKAVEQKNEFIKSNIDLQKQKEINRLKELQEEKKINEFAVKKQQLQEMRKKKEEEKFKEKQAMRQKLIDKQIEYLSNLKNKEDEIITKQIKDTEDKKMKDEAEKKRRIDELKRQIDEDREFQTNRKKDSKVRTKQEEKEFIDFWKDKMKQMEDDERLEKEEISNRNKNLQSFHKYQIDNRKKKGEDEFVREQEDAFKTKLMLNNEQDEFLQYAENCVREYYNTGKDITPLILDLKKYKKNTQYY
jgi:hypothetical protein